MTSPRPSDVKFCPGCGLEKSTSEFWRNATKEDGLQDECKTCLGERQRLGRLRSVTESSQLAERVAELEAALAAEQAKVAVLKEMLVEALRNRE